MIYFALALKVTPSGPRILNPHIELGTISVAVTDILMMIHNYCYGNHYISLRICTILYVPIPVLLLLLVVVGVGVVVVVVVVVVIVIALV